MQDYKIISCATPKALEKELKGLPGYELVGPVQVSAAVIPDDTVFYEFVATLKKK